MAVTNTNKAKAGAGATAGKEKGRNTSTGQPAQHKQASRKGKAAWRKNVDLTSTEAALEELRAEERATGGATHAQSDQALFVEDRAGDDRTARRVRSQRPLRSLDVLRSRTAVPAVSARTRAGFDAGSGAEARARAAGMPKKMQDRLRRIAHRTVKGPFGAVIESEQGSTRDAEPSQAVLEAGSYNVWAEDAEDAQGKGKRKAVEQKQSDGWIDEFVAKKRIKTPATVTLHKSSISVPAVSLPHPGASYNPELSAHEALLAAAYEKERLEEGEIQRLDRVRKEWEERRKGDRDLVPGAHGAERMQLDGPAEEDEEEQQQQMVESEDEETEKRDAKRKTKAQRARAARAAEELRAVQARKRARAERGTYSELRKLRKGLDAATAARAAAVEERRARKAARLAKEGVKGQRIGKHIVPEGRVDVQLGEELSESLRALKPEGNLFRDRFLSMQHRALAEPRVPVLPKRRNKVREYETHSYKRFE